jgi:hypothetical protein
MVAWYYRFDPSLPRSIDAPRRCIAGRHGSNLSPDQFASSPLYKPHLGETLAFRRHSDVLPILVLTMIFQNETSLSPAAFQANAPVRPLCVPLLTFKTKTAGGTCTSYGISYIINYSVSVPYFEIFELRRHYDRGKIGPFVYSVFKL